jgi:hypothetical protein
VVAAVTTNVSQAAALVAVREPTANTQLSQGSVLVAGAYPAQFTRTSQLTGVAAVSTSMNINASQMGVLVAALGRVNDPHVRAWTFTLDGHDFYVLRLGNLETIVYDALADQWYDWGSGDNGLWRAFCGCNWQGGNNLAAVFGSNVIVGDDGNGSLYFLDPNNAYDDDATFGSATPRTFLREITGEVSVSSFDYVPCYGVQVIGSAGEGIETALTGVTLFTSDDQGHTYDTQGTVNVNPGDYRTRVEWWSLGAFAAPGRLFKIQDYGALHRIDYLTMIEPPEKD